MAPAQVGYAPTLEKFLKSLKGRNVEASIEDLVALLKRRQIRDPEPCAIATTQILLQVVAKAKWADVDELLDRIQHVGRRVTEASPRELVIGNVVRRVLGLIRDEAFEDRNGNEFGSDSASVMQTASSVAAATTLPRPLLFASSSFAAPKSMFSLLSADLPTDSSATASPYGRSSGASTPVTSGPGQGGQAASAHALRSEVIDGIEEIKDEIGQADDQIAGFAEIQIHPGDHVLVYNPSATVQRFLISAAKKRRFTVLLACGRGRRGDHEGPLAAFRKKLSSARVESIIIADSAITATMPKVSKVLLDARAVLADGGLIADAGAGLMARAAREHGKPVLVLSGVYKVCPQASFDRESLIDWGDPSEFVSFADGTLVDGADVQNAQTDFVPADVVDVYITNLGPHSRDHLQSVIADHYKTEDVDFHLQ